MCFLERRPVCIFSGLTLETQYVVLLFILKTQQGLISLKLENLLLYSENGGSTFLGNVGTYPTD
jgi:hypothetical protein